MTTSRREFLKVAGGAAAAARGRRPGVARAQAVKGVPMEPVKIGVIAIRAGIAAPVGTAGLRGTEWWADRVNKAGGILGRQVQLVIEEESSPKDTVERYRKLILQDKVDVVIGGISTGVTLALGPVAEEMDTPWLSWDGTTQKGVEETMPNPKWAFRSVDNEVEAIVAGQLTPKYFKGVQDGGGHRQRLLLRPRLLGDLPGGAEEARTRTSSSSSSSSPSSASRTSPRTSRPSSRPSPICSCARSGRATRPSS